MAMNGFLQNGVCYSDIDSAYSSYVSSLPYPVAQPNIYIDLNFLSSPLGSWGGLSNHYFFNFYDVVGSLITFNHSFYIPAPVFQSCDPLQPFLDGSFLGFTVAGAVISVSLLAVLRRAL